MITTQEERIEELEKEVAEQGRAIEEFQVKLHTYDELLKRVRTLENPVSIFHIDPNRPKCDPTEQF